MEKKRGKRAVSIEECAGRSLINVRMTRGVNGDEE